MTTSVSVSVRSLVVAATSSAAVLAAYLVGSASPGGDLAAATQANPPSDTPSIAMTGSGSVMGVPDQLTFEVSVQVQAPDVSTALASANTKTRAVLLAVRAEGVGLADVKTTGLSIHPAYDYSGDGPGVITGYRVSEDLSVLVRDLPDAGETISAAVAAGGNSVRLHGVRLQVGDKDALLRQARDAAIADAQAKAEQYAAAADSSLGDVMSVREVHASAPSPVSRDQLYATSAEASVPIRAGTSELEVTVSVVWSLG
jgi:uncharacterized protein YggE